MKNFQIRIFSNKKNLYFQLIFPRDRDLFLHDRAIIRESFCVSIYRRILGFLFNRDVSEEWIRISSAEAKSRISHRIDIGDETVKIFGIYSFHRFSAKIRKALSSWVKALGARQLCQMSFFGACKSYRLFRTNILSNISSSVLLFFSREMFHFNLAMSYNF